jgi:hypothetical protein
MSKTDTFILWPEGKAKPQKATNPHMKGDVFSADQLPEPVVLGQLQEVKYKGKRSLAEHVGKTIRIATIKSKKLTIHDTGLTILPSIVLDRDIGFGTGEATFMVRLRKLVGNVKEVQADFKKGLDFENYPADRGLDNIRKALDGKWPLAVLEGIVSLSNEESSILTVLIDSRVNELMRGIPIAAQFKEKLMISLRNNIDPEHKWTRHRKWFILKPKELSERFQTVHDGAGYDAANAAEDIMEHYAIVGNFTEPSKDQYLLEIIEGLGHKNPHVRSFLTSALVFLKPIRAFQYLPPLLEDKSRSVRKAAIMALGELRDERAVKHIRKFLDDANPEVREITVASLYVIGGHQSYRLLEKRLRKEEDVVIRDDIRRALEELKH